MKFSEKIVFMRKKRGISQEQVAKKIGVSRQTVYKWEADINTPEFNKIKKLSEIFGISYNLLLDDSIDLEEYFLRIENGEGVSEYERESLDTACENSGKSEKRIPLIICVSLSIVLVVALIIGLTIGLSSNNRSDTSTSSDSEDVTLKIFKITFDANGGILKGNSTIDVAYGMAVGNLPIVEKQGCTFLGWFDSNGNKIAPSTVAVDDMMLTAKYSENTVSLYFDANGGNVDEKERTVEIGQKIGKLPIPLWDGHMFLYWKANNRIINSETVIDVDTVVKAIWGNEDEIVSLTLTVDGEKIENGVIWVEKDALLSEPLPIPIHKNGLEFLGWFTEEGVLVTKSTRFFKNTVLNAYFGTLEACPFSKEDHKWSNWDENNIKPTCIENGTRSRYCYDCLYKVTEITNEATGHSYGQWSYDRMKQQRQCSECFFIQNVEYVNLYDKIDKTQITGEVFAPDNWTCLYDGDWEQEYPVFCGKYNEVTVDIILTEATEVECIFVKGASDCAYTISVLYENETEYSVISTDGKFGDIAMRFDIEKTITAVKIYMPNATPSGYWQEIAIAQIPEAEE